MPATTCMGIPNVERVLFKELFKGDYDKFNAISNIAQTGGGARDLRFSGVVELRPAILGMCPTMVPSIRVRAAGPYVDLCEGTLRWAGGSMYIYFEPPQDERDNEWRLAQVASMPPFAGRQMPANYHVSNREVILLLQDSNFDIWPVIDYRSQVVQDPAIGQFIANGFSNHHNSGHALVGYVDFLTGTGWVK